MATALRSISFVFVGLLLVAMFHKARAVTAHTAAEEPLLQITAWRRRHARSLLVAAAFVEAMICAALVLLPTAGFVALSILTLFYAVDLRGLSPSDGCNCFGSAFRSRSRRTAVGRNALIATISAGCAVLYATSTIPVAAVSQTTVGVALLIMAGATSVELLRFVPRAEPRARYDG